MRIFKGRHLLVGAAVLVAAPIAAVALAGSVSGASSPNVAVTCAKLEGTTQLQTATLGQCTAGATGGNGTVANFTLGGGDVTWANSTTTDYTATATQQGKKCPKLSKEYKIVGSVTSSTNASIPNGAAVKMSVCFDQMNDQARIVTGTTVKF
jgi:hypothetical protein